MSGPPGVTISLTEEQGFQAMGQFLVAYCAPYPITVVRGLGSTAPGSNVRVPEPINGDFVVMSSLRTARLETNETTFQDNICVGSIDGTILTVTAITRGTLAPGQLVIDLHYPNGVVLPNTAIVRQLSGATPGGIGTYEVSVSQAVASETLYAGTRKDQVSTEWVVQIDVHGPNSMQNAMVVETLFRSEVGVDFFRDTGFWIAPLYIDAVGMTPFENAEQEVEFRWVAEAHLDIVPIVTTFQAFADEIKVRTIEAGVIYTGS